jgi:hypothetical protein
VIIQVDIQIAKLCSAQDALAISILIFVAKEAVVTLTKLFHIRIVISNLSELLFNNFKLFAPIFLCFTNESILWFARDIKAISLQEKKADKPNKSINRIIDKGSIFFWLKVNS